MATSFKIASFSDLHANRVALAAIVRDIQDWAPDVVIANGDLINQGPKPRECLDYMSEMRANHHWLVTRGNHEDYVLGAAPNERSQLHPLQQKLFFASAWTYGQLTPEQLADIASWPMTHTIETGFKLRVIAAHASPTCNFHGLAPRMTDDELLARTDMTADLFLTAHTHVPFTRQLGKTLIVNSGSASLPLDGDTRISYARVEITPGYIKADIRRIDFEREAFAKDMQEVMFYQTHAPFVRLMEQERKDARPHSARWRRQYESMFLAGEITAEESVDRYLREAGFL